MQNKVKLLLTKFHPLISVLEILPAIWQVLQLKVLKETTKLNSESEFFGGTSVSCKVKDKENLHKLY